MRPLLLALAACRADPAPAPGVRTVDVVEVLVSIELEPQVAGEVTGDDSWLWMPHCGTLGIDGDELVSIGPLPEEVEAVAMIDYGLWGRLFSGGGSTDLELPMGEHGFAEVRAALDTPTVLYPVFDNAEARDTGVPGGESVHRYAANGFSEPTTAIETHTHLPVRALTVRETEPVVCAR